MRPIALDTNTYAAFLRAEPVATKVFESADVLQLSTVVLGELLAGFACGSREERNRDQLAQFLASPRVSAMPLTSTTADAYALIYRSLRKRGTPIPTNDLWIAASCLEHGTALFSYDKHFAVVEGLRWGQSLEAFLP
ncbi:MAG: type II toxin-antitoxin system VapC family toxin [Synechococcaceae cyanobacterium MAG-AL2]|uniref:type II toxin-antitoxin system VapC family toxin n=1 Tax=Candidatus Regnicoccus frigidus TaxID=3074015 RepID=UPI0028373765|nr:type II toxin-antitoxin system VapC family toxin [Candidatus Regnicoccus frigidus]MCT4367012.1 type II toxin-antitoxin system VapC family toxin [Candidatus Regnicoccus frigidus MAG-AL2]